MLTVSLIGFTTITSTAVLFAKTTLHMPASSLILIGVLVPSAGILGSLLWPRLQRRLAWTNLHALTLLVVLAALIPLYGCLGFLWGVIGWKVRFGGLTSPEEMFVIAIYFGEIFEHILFGNLEGRLCSSAVSGSLYGAFQSYARTVFAELIPPGEEARWYGPSSPHTAQYLISRPSHLFQVRSVLHHRQIELVHRPTGRRHHSRRDWQYTLCILLPRFHAPHPHPCAHHESRCGSGQGRCTRIRSSATR